MQSVDFTTLMAACAELREGWLPSRIEQVYQSDRFTIALGLRTFKQRGWLTLCWHPQGARLGLGEPPPRLPDTFTFSDQLRHQLVGLALSEIVAIAPWERVVDLKIAKRPGEAPRWHLYLEVMGKYSNAILTDGSGQIVSVAHQVSAAQSSLRTVQTGQPYQPPPPLAGVAPSREEPLARWREQIALISGPLSRQLVKTYRGVSPVIARSLAQRAGLDPDRSTAQLGDRDWERLFESWQAWLHLLETEAFEPGWTETGYTLLGWEMTASADSVQALLHRYYQTHLNQQAYEQLRHQLAQKLKNLLAKARQKAVDFRSRLQQSAEADQLRYQADLLMAYLHQWQAGMTQIALPDFATGDLVTISLEPEKNAVQNAQRLYKRHQKLKRAAGAILPLLTAVTAEIEYLEQVEASLSQLGDYHTLEDLSALEEIREELIDQGYWDVPPQRRPPRQTQPHHYQTPSGFLVLAGRNNRQNDELTFRTASDYDLWFHTQEIPGSHVLLRLEPGAVPEAADLQVAADLAAYFSRGRQSDRVPVVYTEPRHVYKPKGAKPGMAIYKQERILWGRPQQAQQFMEQKQSLPGESKGNANSH
ncbi:MAG: fibronectin/fibrinogen-binding protein [Chloroflexaceae bacterium]|nr:fibronectin/fibrinogen-binding protein [Chloroflexaceae bacterium]